MDRKVLRRLLVCPLIVYFLLPSSTFLVASLRGYMDLGPMKYKGNVSLS